MESGISDLPISIELRLNYLLKEILFLMVFVCLSVNNFTQKVINGFRWNFLEVLGVVQGTIDWILEVIGRMQTSANVQG